MRKDNPSIVREYEASVGRVFDEYQPISESEYRKLNGRNFVTSIARQRLGAMTDEIRLLLDGDEFVVVACRDGTDGEVFTNSLFTGDRFEQIREAVLQSMSDGLSDAWSVRVGKQDCAIRVAVATANEVTIHRA